MNKNISIILTLLTLTFSCKFNDKKSVVETKTTDNDSIYKNDSLTYILNSNKQYIKDSLLKEKFGIVENYFSLYQSDTCGILTHKNSELKEEFEGIRNVNGIRTDKKNDTVFVMPNTLITVMMDNLIVFLTRHYRDFIQTHIVATQTTSLFVATLTKTDLTKLEFSILLA